jgi:hypothetical protein
MIRQVKREEGEEEQEGEEPGREAEKQVEPVGNGREDTNIERLSLVDPGPAVPGPPHAVSDNVGPPQGDEDTAEAAAFLLMLRG